jgi:predicted ATPase
MGPVAITLFGAFAATVDGSAVADSAWRLRKARELVKLLAVAPGHSLHREQLMDVLWGDRAPDAAANNLHQAVYVARRALDPDAIQVGGEVLHLEATVDVDAFRAAAAEARQERTQAAYRAALSIYAGELLPENRYDDWAAEAREELRQLVAALEDELAAAPGPEEDLPSPLPAEASTFVGRGPELAETTALLHGTRLLTLCGPGGVGKTRLALELTRSVRASYPHGTALLALASIEDGSLVPVAAAAALDLRGMPGQKLTDAVSDYIGARRVLLVIDNCEHLLGATAAFTDSLLRSAPGLTVLATSREPLRVAGEVVFRVPSLGIPDPDQGLSPAELLAYDAVRLFVARAEAVAPGFSVDEDNAVDVARICFRLDGLPLALELAAGRLGALGPAAVAERLDDRFRVLRANSHAAPTRQQTLGATLQWSHDLLEPDEQVLFRRLSVFAGGFGLEAVEEVAAGVELDVAEVADILARLVEKSLVAADEGNSRQRRYRLLETVRVYARERLDEAAETHALTAAHAQWALHLTERARRSLELDREAPNLRAALDTLLVHSPVDGLRLCVALWPFWMRRIDLREAQHRFDLALAAAPERTALRAEALRAAAAIDYRGGELARGQRHAQESHSVASEIGDVRAQWRALQFLGEFGLANDAADEALPWLERALQLAASDGLRSAEAISVYSLGVVHWVLGDLARSEEFLARSIELFSAVDDPTERIPSPVNLAEFKMSQPGGRPGLRFVFEDSLQPFVEISCHAAVGYAKANRAAIVRARGDLAGARRLLDESGRCFAELDDDAGKAAVLVRLAYLELAEDAIDPARAALQEALELRQGLRDRRGVGLVLAGLGLIETTDGDLDSAQRRLAEAHDIFRRAGDRWGLASTLWRIADLEFVRGRVEEAENALLRARSVLESTGRSRWIANTLVGLAEIAVVRGEIEPAAALLQEARELYAARDDLLGVADVEERLLAIASPAAGAVRPAEGLSSR